MKPTRRLPRPKTESLPPSYKEATSGTRRAAKRMTEPPPAAVAPLPSQRPTVKLGRVKAPEAPVVHTSISLLAQVSLDRIPYVTMPKDVIRALSLSPKHAFVLGLIDGRTSIEVVLDTCPLSTHQVLRILGELQRDGVVALK